MEIKDNILVLNNEITNDMLEDFMKLAYSDTVLEFNIKTGSIDALILQQLFCLSKTKKIICEDEFLKKFFSNIVIAT